LVLIKKRKLAVFQDEQQLQPHIVHRPGLVPATLSPCLNSVSFVHWEQRATIVTFHFLRLFR
jgi:hypothetical protein